MPMHVLAFAVIAAKRVPGGKCLFDANLKHSLLFLEIRPWTFVLIVLAETQPHPSVPVWLRIPGETPRKFYHTPCVESGYRAAPARRDRSLSERGVRTPVSARAPLGALGTPKMHCAHPPVEPSRAPRQSGR